MVNWQDWVDGETIEERQRPSLKKRINKNIYCKKNVNQTPPTRGIMFGPHIYENNSNRCKLCGHKKKDHNQEKEYYDD